MSSAIPLPSPISSQDGGVKAREELKGSPSSGQNRRNASRIPELDGLRGVAILLVVLFHYIWGLTGNSGSHSAAFIRNCVGMSWSGVDLFFVLSGFLIGGILMDHREDKNYFKTFYIRRICRILPLYFLWVALFFMLPALLSTFASSGWYSDQFERMAHFPQWGYFFFLQNFAIAASNNFGPNWMSVTWSLCIEEQFYLLAPLMIWFLSPRKLPAALVSLIFLGLGFRLFLYLYHPLVFTYVLLPCRPDGLLLGILCAYLTRNAEFRNAIKNKRAWLYALFAALLGGMVYLSTLTAKIGFFSSLNSFDMISYGYLCVGLFYACFLLITVTDHRGPFARAMRARWLGHFGIISYCIYVIHNAVLGFAPGLVPGSKSGTAHFFLVSASTLLSFFIVWLLAILSWKFFEKPIIGLGHSFLYGEPGTPPEGAFNETRLESTQGGVGRA